MHRHKTTLTWSVMVVFSFLSCSSKAIGDTFFDKAIKEAQNNIAVPQTSYGFRVIDEFVTENIGQSDEPLKERSECDFYTEQNKFCLRELKFDQAKLENTNYYSYETILKEHGEKEILIGATGVLSGDKGEGPYIRYNNLKRSAFTIGAFDTYIFDVNKENNRLIPKRQPYQMLVNPCLANIEVDLNDTLKSQVSLVESNDNLRIYEVKIDNYKTLRMHFLNSQPTMLVKTIYSIGDRYLSIRSVDEYYKFNGMYITSKFSFFAENKGQNKYMLSREIKDVTIGDIADDQFSSDKLADFQHTWDAIYDYESDMMLDTKIEDTIIDAPIYSNDNIQDNTANNRSNIVRISADHGLSDNSNESLKTQKSNSMEADNIISNAETTMVKNHRLLFVLILLMVPAVGICLYIMIKKSNVHR